MFSEELVAMALNRTSISKMLGHHTASSPSSSSLIVTSNSSQKPTLSINHSKRPSTATSAIKGESISASTKPKVPHNASRLSTLNEAADSSSHLTRSLSEIETPILYNNEFCPASFVVHKLVEFLQTQKRMITVAEVEAYLRGSGFLGLRILSNKELLKAIQANKRILFDSVRQKLAFISPYENIISVEALFTAITYDGHLTGLRVTDDLLSAHASMKQWIHELLGSRRIRCVRPNNSHMRGKLKCRFTATDRMCWLYSRVKCQECLENVKELILYPLGESEIEAIRYQIDPDVKGLWDSIELPTMEEILKDCNISVPIQRYDVEPARPAKRGKDPGSGKFFTKMRRIQNTHLFTAEELRSEIKQQRLFR